MTNTADPDLQKPTDLDLFVKAGHIRVQHGHGKCKMQPEWHLKKMYDCKGT